VAPVSEPAGAREQGRNQQRRGAPWRIALL